MKKKIPDQLRAYIEQIKHPDEHILVIEKQHMDGVSVFELIFAYFILLAALVATCLLTFFISAFFAFVAVPVVAIIVIFLPGLLLSTAYLAVTDKAVYFCTGLLSTDVFVWSYSEIAMVECMQNRIRITSTHHQSEILDFTPVKTAAFGWKSLILALSGKPLTHRWFSLTQFYALPRNARGSGYDRLMLEESTLRLKLIFRIGSDSLLRGAFTEAVKKNPHVKIGYDNIPIE